MEYPKDPDDGHTHKWQFAEGMDTKTDADPYICLKCGLVKVMDDEDGDDGEDDNGQDRESYTDDQDRESYT